MQEKVGYHLRETALSLDQTLTDMPNGNIQVMASSPNSEQLRWWLRMFSIAKVEVLEPEALRQEFVDEVQAMAKMYSR